MWALEVRECILTITFPLSSRASFHAMAVVQTVIMKTHKVGTLCLGETPAGLYPALLAPEGEVGEDPAVQLAGTAPFLSPPGPRLDGKRFLELGKEDELHPELESLDGDLDPGLPSTEDVILKTEQVTKNIQELLRAAQEFKHDR